LVSSAGLSCVKLSDMGMARTLSTSPYYHKASNDKIPVRWMAPESVVHRKYSTKSDVWSFGVLVWEVLSRGALPFQELTTEGTVSAVLRGQRLAQPPQCPDPLFACCCDVL
jgi:focal adhesion kinase 1